MLLPVLCFFVRTIVAKSGKLLPEIECLESLCTVVELYRKGKDGQDVADLLAQAGEKHGNLFLAVYEQEPKPRPIMFTILPCICGEMGTSSTASRASGSTKL